jgi:hypothetical protein
MTGGGRKPFVLEKACKETRLLLNEDKRPRGQENNGHPFAIQYFYPKKYLASGTANAVIWH